MSDAHADELYGLPPEEFVARRDAIAKELRKAGDRAAADELKKLRRPSAAAAAVNGLARSASDEVEGLLAAGEALRQAQLGGGDRAAIQSAARDEREAVESLVARAGKLSPSVTEEVRSTLHAAAVDDETRELVRRGMLTEAQQASGLGGFAMPAGAPGPPAAKPKRRGGPRAGAGPGGEEDGAAESKRQAKAEAEAEAARKKAGREAEAERKKAARERVKAARAALRDAQKAASAAEREAEAARKEVERRRTELEQAEAEA